MRREHQLTFILAGRSGSGKTTMAEILESELGLHRCVTSTTCPPRAGEEDGRTYHFLSEMDRTQMFESACFGGFWYGTSIRLPALIPFSRTISFEAIRSRRCQKILFLLSILFCLFGNRLCRS